MTTARNPIAGLLGLRPAAESGFFRRGVSLGLVRFFGVALELLAIPRS